MIVAVGNPEEFAKPLDRLWAEGDAIDLTIPDAKLAVTASDPASLESGQQLSGDGKAAVGGATKLAEVKDYVETAEAGCNQS